MKHHNPKNVSLTTAEIDAGWRICFLEELKDRIPNDAEFYSERMSVWVRACDAGKTMNEADERATTFRTKTPVPLGHWGTIHNPTEVKLSAKDISQGWRFCFLEELQIAKPHDSLWQQKFMGFWEKSSSPGTPMTQAEKLNTYITKTPVPQGLRPAKPAEVPEDIFGELSKLFG